MANVLSTLSATLASGYRIERELGQGGMATVYLGHDLRHGRAVALKVLRPELAATSRFRAGAAVGGARQLLKSREVCMRRLLVPLVLLAACRGAGPTLTEQQSTAIADTVRQLADTYLADIRAVSYDRLMAAFGPELVWAENGVLASNRDSLATAWRAVVASWRSVSRATWTGSHVRVLGPDAAVISATFDWAATDTAGAALATRGAWTAVYVRTDAGWKIAYGHESYLPAPPPPSTRR